MRESSIWGDMLDALTNQYRRQLLVALSEHNPQEGDDPDPLCLLADSEEPTVDTAELRHNHLPKLEAHGFIEWHRETNEISRGPRWDEIAPLITLIEEHREELPDGWL